MRPWRGSRGERRCSRSTIADQGSPVVELRRQLRRELARHPAHLLAAGVHGDRVRVVLVVRVAAQLQRTARLDGLRRVDRLGVMAARSRHAGHVQAA